MTAPARTARAALFVAVAIDLGACGLLAGVNDFSDAPSSSAGAGASSSDGAADALPDVASITPPCDPSETIDESSGVFVSSGTGDDVNGDGSALTPVKTIAKGLQVAAASPKKTVYIDKGNYPEKIVFTSGEAGITVRGGFAREGASWARDCDAFKLTLVQAPDAVAVEVSGTTIASGLSEMTITTKASGKSVADTSGESMYAIHVSGDGTKFSLHGVIVVAGAGGDGGLASAGTTPAAATGSCGSVEPACSDGASGTDGLAAQAGAKGAFTMSGYAPGDGEAGHDGALGHNGVAGSTTTMTGCTTCTGCGALHCSCACCQSGCGNWCEAGTQGSTSVTSPPGPCGCGGPGALGGRAGLGGGASVALFVAGNATVSTSYASLNAGKGGDGSPGGAGAPGASGSAGTTASASCATGNCVCNNTCNPQCGTSGPTEPVTSQAGLAGGHGGSSSKGGGGAGAPSYAVVLVGGATLADDQTILAPSTAGVGADGAPSGSAGAKLVVALPADAGAD